MEVNTLKAKIEALIFAYGEPLSIKKMSELLNIGTDELDGFLRDMEKEYADDEKRGIYLCRLEDKFQLATKKENSKIIKELLTKRKNSQLSPSSLEVLAIIAYNQPVTKAYVEQVRGVDCSYIITALSDKELIDERGRLNAPGRPLLYGTTSNFLRSFGISSLSELPEIPEMEGQQQEFSEEQQIITETNTNEISEEV